MADDLVAVPFASTPAKVSTILETVVAHPWWFTAPSSEVERAYSASLLLHDPLNKVWEVWKGPTFVGVILLWRYQPSVDALLHFVFFDQHLLNKRQLLLNFLGYCFDPDPDGLGLQRVSLEIPEFVHALTGFAIRKLGFHFEGEDRIRSALPADQRTRKVMDPRRAGHTTFLWKTLAAEASRREGAHWHDGEWRDVLCLRQTKAEYVRFQETLCPPPSLPPSLPQPLVRSPGSS